MLFAINYHYVRESFEAPYPSVFGVTPEQFERDAKLLSKTSRVVGPETLLEWIERQVPPAAPSVVITFDDGLQEQFELALPILRRLGLPAVFFVNTSPRAESRVSSVHKLHLLRSQVAPPAFADLLKAQARRLKIDLAEPDDGRGAESHYRYDSPDIARIKYLLNFLLEPEERRHLAEACFEAVFPGQEADLSQRLYMSPDQLKSLAAEGMTGSHSHHHLPLGRLSEASIRGEIRSSLDLLEQWTGKRPVAMSYPYGSPEACTDQVGRIAREEGVRFAFTMERAGNADWGNPWFLARYANNDFPFEGGAHALRDFFRRAPASRGGRQSQ